MEEAFELRVREHDTVPVSELAPFISNLNILDNIALVQESKRNFLLPGVTAVIMEKLARFGLEERALHHSDHLNHHQTFLVQLIRASMMDDADIIIDRPFSLVPTAKDLDYFLDAIAQLELPQERLHIIDLVRVESYYKEYECPTVKC